MRYNKGLLIHGLAMDTGLPKKDVAKIIDALIGYIHGAVFFGGSVVIRGFGKFYPRVSRAKQEVVAFRPAKKGVIHE